MNNDGNDYIILSIYLVFGILINAGYGKMIYDGNSSELWSNKGTNRIMNNEVLKNFYIFMIIISYLFGIYLIYYLTITEKEKTDGILIYTGSILLLFFSTLWAFKPFYYNKFVLFMVFIGALLLLSGICINDNEEPEDPFKISAIVAVVILCIQTGLFDGLIWTGIV